MLEREPFYKILIMSIETYYKVVEGKIVNISSKKNKNAKLLFLYYKPSFLSERFITKDMRNFLYSEYNIRGALPKFLIGKFGVFIITHSYGLFAKEKFYLCCSEGLLNERIFISPCNRSIRFYNFSRGYVDCIVKEGYSDKYMLNQLQFRLNYNHFCIPKILASGERWYREKIMYGNPLIRVRKQDAFLKGQDQALANLKELVNETLEYIDIDFYVKTLREELFILLATLSADLDDSDMVVFHRLSELTEIKIKDCRFTVPTAVTHGDFQGGNIWLTKQNEIIIYDWETNKRRSVWFDPATYYWKLHSDPSKINIEQYVLRDNRFLINDNYKNYTRDERVAIAIILFLENTIFYLEDIAQIPKKNLRCNLLKFVVDLKKMVFKG